MNNNCKLIIPVLLAMALISGCNATSPEIDLTTPEVAQELQTDPTDAVMTEQPSSMNGETLLEDRCTGCHSMARATSKTATEDAWLETITRMIGKGAVLTDEEASILAQYLANR